MISKISAAAALMGNDYILCSCRCVQGTMETEILHGMGGSYSH